MAFRANSIVGAKTTALRRHHERETTRDIPTPFWDSIPDEGRYPKDHQPILCLSPEEELSWKPYPTVSPTRKGGYNRSPGVFPFSSDKISIFRWMSITPGNASSSVFSDVRRMEIRRTVRSPSKRNTFHLSFSTDRSVNMNPT